MNLCDVKTIKDVMSIFGLTFRKEFGQNFLTDKSVVEAIADSCAAANTKTVLEIGAGCGSLTHELALRYEKVIAIEIDRGLIPLLGYTLGEHKNVEVVCGDVMKTDICALLGDAFERGGVSVCANLPYYITTPILLELLGSGLPFDCITVMIQSEVADRLCAAPGGKTLMLGELCRPECAITAADIPGLATMIMDTATKELKLSVRGINYAPKGDGTASAQLTVEVPSSSIVDMLLHSLRRIKGVRNAYRIN